MRPSSYACLLALGCLLAAAPASASAEFPIVIQNHLNLPDAYIPDCTLCHATDTGGLNTVTRPFGKQGLARGLKAGDAKLDDGEFLETFTATIPEMLEMVKRGEITDVKTVIGTFWLEKIAAGTWTPA